MKAPESVPTESAEKIEEEVAKALRAIDSSTTAEATLELISSPSDQNLVYALTVDVSSKARTDALQATIQAALDDLATEDDIIGASEFGQMTFEEKEEDPKESESSEEHWAMRLWPLWAGVLLLLVFVFVALCKYMRTDGDKRDMQMELAASKGGIHESGDAIDWDGKIKNVAEDRDTNTHGELRIDPSNNDSASIKVITADGENSPRNP